MHIYSVHNISQHRNVSPRLERRYLLPNSEFKRAEFVHLLYCSTSEFLYFDIPLTLLQSSATFVHLPIPKLSLLCCSTPLFLYFWTALSHQSLQNAIMPSLEKWLPRQYDAKHLIGKTTNTWWGKLSCSKRNIWSHHHPLMLSGRLLLSLRRVIFGHFNGFKAPPRTHYLDLMGQRRN